MSDFVVISSCNNDSIMHVESIIKKVSSRPGIKSLLILSCEKNSFSVHDLLEISKKIDIPVFGGIFPALIAQSKLLWKGIIVIGFSLECAGGIIHDIHDEKTDIFSEIKSLLPPFGKNGTVLILVDGLSGKLNRFVWTVKDTIGKDNVYIGGGAGSLSLKSQPCLFSNRETVKSAAIILQFPCTGSIGVAHGWEPIKGPFHVTGAENNSIITLNSQPAFEVYKSVLKEQIGEFDSNDFVSIAKSYPFGIQTVDDEHIVRDPISFNNKNAIQCVGEIPAGVKVDILYGDKDTLLSAASWAYKIASENAKKSVHASMHFMVDCISRVMFLGKDFDQELAAVSIDSNELFGICSLGEIADSKNGYLEFYNKTITMGIFDIEVSAIDQKCD